MGGGKESFRIALVPVKKLIKSRTYMQPERAALFGSRCICQRKTMISIVAIATKPLPFTLNRIRVVSVLLSTQ